VLTCQHLLHLGLQLREQRTGVCNVLPVLIPQYTQFLLCGLQLLLAGCKLLLQSWRAALELLVLLLLQVPLPQLCLQKIDLRACGQRHRQTRGSQRKGLGIGSFWAHTHQL
jgi:hypothetical protein